MRAEVTPKFVSLAKGAAKVIRFTVKIRQVSSLSESLSEENWIDITGFINGKSFPSISHRIEYEMGQFASDKITLESDDIQKWKTLLPITHPFLLDVDSFESSTAMLG